MKFVKYKYLSHVFPRRLVEAIRMDRLFQFNVKSAEMHFSCSKHRGCLMHKKTLIKLYKKFFRIDRNKLLCGITLEY